MFISPSSNFSELPLMSVIGLISWRLAQGHLIITKRGASFTHPLAHIAITWISGCAILLQAFSTCIILPYSTCPPHRHLPTSDLHLPFPCLPWAFSPSPAHPPLPCPSQSFPLPTVPRDSRYPSLWNLLVIAPSFFPTHISLFRHGHH